MGGKQAKAKAKRSHVASTLGTTCTQSTRNSSIVSYISSIVSYISSIFADIQASTGGGMFRSRFSPFLTSDPSTWFSSTTDEVSDSLHRTPPWGKNPKLAAAVRCCAIASNRKIGRHPGTELGPRSAAAPRRRVRSSSTRLPRWVRSPLDDSTVLLWLGLYAAAEGRGEVGLGLGAAEPTCGGVVRTRRLLGGVEGAEPYAALLPRVADLGGVAPPRPLPYAAVADLLDAAVLSAVGGLLLHHYPTHSFPKVEFRLRNLGKKIVPIN
ncbi:small and basic intrinsic protein 2 [Striga asiatica]|uniref:Small and basic intrinsic protein 2 n=1 Tax=Striga asiatica TaxID=4170 RepID=A0A5A7QD25_STRAF|nr:small and basic intrinsic protein 2 [Striga asiatica]